MTSVHIPESHRDLLDGGSCVALATVMPDGQPQITPVWCNREGDYVLLNTMRGFRKERNMRDCWSTTPGIRFVISRFVASSST